MGEGRGGLQFTGDELGILARVVLSRIRPNRADREGADDCFQTAYLAGLEARRSAARNASHTSSSVLILAMQTAVYRALGRRKELRESDLQPSA